MNIAKEVLDTIKSWFHPKVGHGISIIIPFHPSKEQVERTENLLWLVDYWKCHLPGAQIILGADSKSTLDANVPFSKSCAVNHAAKMATGDIFVIVDADGFIDSKSVLLCAEKIRRARERGHRLWYVPYRQFYRLSKNASRRLLKSIPCHPLAFPTPPNPCDILNTSGSQHGHWFGAGIQILPREAFDKVGGWDERFRGWGGEDHAATRATDTLYWTHKTLPGQFLHIWHPMFSSTAVKEWVDWNERIWAGQVSSGANDELSRKYYGANGHQERMRKLVQEGR